MGAQIGWLIPDKVVIIRVYGHLQGSEYAAMLKAARKMQDESPETILHAIVDGTDLDHMPPLNILTRGSRSPKLKWIFTVGLGNQILRFEAKVATNTMKLKLKMVDEIDEALAILKRIDHDVKLDEIVDEITWVEDYLMAS